MNQSLKEGEDFYLTEHGLMVFTKSFLLQRGYCCGNGCRYCPYEYINVPEPDKSFLLTERELQQ